ncbi:hypothetical protein LEP1GSC172_0047 [Leptospira noguchii]|uniref:Uncharacterized protein n=2 Tax=Leptospira noguchii TaxID=28182 RepID=T0FQ58_9LEPT|nr:hypothetical protein LEP1GSC172_0047 [Leptospira noguchii]EQA71710.1 hypothetical protein LEP1GSC059_1079 [Leptospira noguchii serovar Panama str. CZ214]
MYSISYKGFRSLVQYIQIFYFFNLLNESNFKKEIKIGQKTHRNKI